MTLDVLKVQDSIVFSLPDGTPALEIKWLPLSQQVGRAYDRDVVEIRVLAEGAVVFSSATSDSSAPTHGPIEVTGSFEIYPFP